MPDAAPDRDAAGARAAVLARLWGGLSREPIPGVGARETLGDQLVLKLPDGRALRGRADAAQPFAKPPIGFTVDLDGTRHADPGALLRALGLPGQVDRLAAELDNSVANLTLARAAQPAPDGGTPLLMRAGSAEDPLAYLEQSVVDGHPLHPCCRTRMGLSADEVRAYAPEYRPVVNLHRFAVPPDRWVGSGPPVLVVHPWQRDHALDAYPWLRPVGDAVPARPLMSLRTLSLAGDPGTHLKTAVEVQMTSAVRTVSPAAIHNGPMMSALLAHLTADLPGLQVMPEVAAGAALVDGEPSRSLAFLRRRMPALAPDDVALPFAALAAPSPVDGRSMVLELVEEPLSFVEAVAALVLPPLLTLYERGVALEAHGQNLLLMLSGGRPHRLLYRDLGGIRVSPYQLGRHGIEVPPLYGDLATDDPAELRAKLLASAVSTVLGELIAVLARELGLDGRLAWQRVAGVARRHPAAGPAGLFGDTLPLKATTAMRLARDPLEDVWTQLPNPMGGLG